MWFFTGYLIWYHTHKHTHYIQGPVDQHTYIDVYNYITCYVLTADIFITLND